MDTVLLERKNWLQGAIAHINNDDLTPVADNALVYYPNYTEDIHAGRVTPASRNSLVSMVLSSIIEEPVEKLEIVHGFQRILTVSYLLYNKPDPVLPLSRFRLGNKHNEWYRRLGGLLESWSPQTPQREWYRAATRCADAVMEEVKLTRWLTNDEEYYYNLVMRYSISHPRIGSFSPQRHGRAYGDVLDIAYA